MNRVFALVCLGTCAGWLSATAKAQTAEAPKHKQTSSSRSHTAPSHQTAATLKSKSPSRKVTNSGAPSQQQRKNFVAVRHIVPPSTRTPPTKGTTSKNKGKPQRKKRSAAPSYQLHPDPERYSQIQKALADRGYFKGTADGTWGDDSVDAMRRFQTDQKLEPDGKITAPALIGLGLGPVHDGRSGHDVEAPSPAPNTEVAPGQTPPAANSEESSTDR